MWKFFKRYHYLNTSLNASAQCFLGVTNRVPVAFFAVLHFPHPSIKNMKRGHRLVVLPDYQGLGIGHQLSSWVAEYFHNQGFRFGITSSTHALFHQRSQDPRWTVTRKGRTSGGYSSSDKALRRTLSSKKLTYSYEYVGAQELRDA